VAADGSGVTLSSAYMAHDEPAPPEPVVKLLQWAEVTKTTLVLGCDANARHTLWGSSETNERGESLFDNIICRNVTICNKGNTPTFIFPSTENFQGWEEVLDLTLLIEQNKYRVENWRVSTEHSFSDHRYIFFDITVPAKKQVPRRNPRKTDWKVFSEIVRSKVNGRRIKTISTAKALDKEVEDLTNILNNAFKETCKLTFSKKQYPPWWTKELSELRKSARKSFNHSYATRDWGPYKEAQKIYKKAVGKAKKESWQNYCESLEGIKDTARVSKILAKGHISPTLINRADGSATTTIEESLELLVDTHFPGSLRESSEPVEGTSSQMDTLTKDIITTERIQWAIDSFDKYKSPGPDGLLPAMLQSAKDSICKWLKAIYEACLRLTHVPL
ncbi:hypothetical protein KR200_006474, partial [Drosophila serrata]